MSREIKFRAWTMRFKIKWQLVYFSLKTLLDGFGDEAPFLSEDEYPYLDEDNPIMQFTGLHDKNGKEIYEGDIIEGLHDFGPGGWDKRLGKIEWKGDGYWMHYWKDYEVIGNIYENPELLKGSTGD